MNDWFRSWHGAPTDNKWLVIARKAGVVPGVVSAVVWALLDYASQSADRGSIADFDVETYAAFSGFDEEQIAAVIEALKEKGIIGPDGGFRNWQKRQPKREDGSAERAKAWRERQQTQNERTQTQANAGERQIREDTDKIIPLATAKDAAASSEDPSVAEKALFDRGKEVLGKSAGGQIVKLLKAKGGNVALARAIIETASQKQNPSEYVAAAIRQPESQSGNRSYGHARKDRSVQDVARALEQWAREEDDPGPVFTVVGG